MTPEMMAFHVIFSKVFYLVASAADWYTTKRFWVDKNLKAIERGEEPPHKEMSPLNRLLFGEPSRNDEWTFLALKVIFAIAIFLGGAGPGWWYISAVPIALMAINNKWQILGKILKKLKK